MTSSLDHSLYKSFSMFGENDYFSRLSKKDNWLKVPDKSKYEEFWMYDSKVFQFMFFKDLSKTSYTSIDDPQHILDVKDEIDYAVEFFRRCLGDKVILSVVGDLRKKGITDSNNPFVDSPIWGVTNAERLYYYGNHKPEDRITWYLKMLFFGLRNNQTLARAHFNAMRYMKTFRAVNFPHLQIAPFTGNPSYIQYHQEDYLPDGSEVTSFIPSNQMKFLGMLRNCLRYYFMDTAKRYVPDVSRQFFKDENTDIMPINKKDSLKADSNDTLYWILGSLMLGATFLRRKQ